MCVYDMLQKVPTAVDRLLEFSLLENNEAHVLQEIFGWLTPWDWCYFRLLLPLAFILFWHKNTSGWQSADA